MLDRHRHHRTIEGTALVSADDVVPNLAAAHVILAALWSATVPSPDVFALPRFQWAGSIGAHDSNAAARHLATLRKPVAVGARVAESTIVEIIELSTDDGTSSCCLADLLPASDGRLLILSGGRARRTPRSALEIACADYRLRLDPAIAIEGSPPDDPWTIRLDLPVPWLDDVSFVVLFGQSFGNQSYSPVRMGDGWALDQLQDL